MSTKNVNDYVKEELAVFFTIKLMIVWLNPPGSTFKKEIQIRAPRTLKIHSSNVCNTTVTPTPKRQLCILHTFASGVRGRLLEMSSLHYQTWLALAHGGVQFEHFYNVAFDEQSNFLNISWILNEHSFYFLWCEVCLCVTC